MRLHLLALGLFATLLSALPAQTETTPADTHPLAPRVELAGHPGKLGRHHTLPDGSRIFLTAVRSDGVVFDRLGPAPTEADQPETIVAGACGVPGGTFADLAAILAHVDAPPPAAEVPVEVTRRQLKEWLIDHDLIDNVEAALAAIPDAKTRRIANNWWTESQTFRRDHPLIATVAASLGLGSAAVDAAFIAAAQL